MTSSGADTFDLLSLPAVANALFVPQAPALQPCYSAHTLLHLRVGLLNVAGGSAGHQASAWNPPMHQPLTLPLSLHLHPALLVPENSSQSQSMQKSSPEAAATAKQIGTDAGLHTSLLSAAYPSASSSSPEFIPPSLWTLQSCILPSILAQLPDMISQIKIKKMDTLRGNRVGIVRTKQFVFTFTFKETQPAYHMLTVSAQRIRQLDAEADARREAATATSASAAAIPGASLSSSLSTFPVFSSPLTPIRLAPLSSMQSPAGAADEGFYSGRGLASYLVSKHTLHVRMIPTRRSVDTMERERDEETRRRAREEKRRREVIEDDGDDGEEDEEQEREQAGTKVRTGNKRKKPSPAKPAAPSSTVAVASTAAKKKQRTDSASADATAASSLAAASAAAVSPEPDSPADAPADDDADLDDWLRMDV